ncbi:MAG TPA: MarR family transcriptional regulator [Solirubrobacterales bacterium]|nr:MarR family transcriptional regulator [Solirubrobacterales bacterium]
MGEKKAKIDRAKTPREGPAAEAWGLLAKLVYPPPFLPIARELGLRPPAFGALRALAEPRTMSEIAAVLDCDNSNVTGIVDGLEERGLAIRTASERDRRVKLIALTAEGRRVRARLMRAFEKPPAWVTEMSAADQRTLRDLLQRANGPDA